LAWRGVASGSRLPGLSPHRIAAKALPIFKFNLTPILASQVWLWDPVSNSSCIRPLKPSQYPFSQGGVRLTARHLDPGSFDPITDRLCYELMTVDSNSNSNSNSNKGKI
jgi:hypothetical protein